MAMKNPHNVKFVKQNFFLFSEPKEGVTCLDCNFQRLTLGNEQTETLLGRLPEVRKTYNNVVAKHDVNGGDCLFINTRGYTVALLFGAWTIAGSLKSDEREILDYTRKAFRQLVDGASKGEVFHLPIMYRSYKGLFPKLVETMKQYKDNTWIVYTL